MNIMNICPLWEKLWILCGSWSGSPYTFIHSSRNLPSKCAHNLAGILINSCPYSHILTFNLSTYCNIVFVFKTDMKRQNTYKQCNSHSTVLIYFTIKIAKDLYQHLLQYSFHTIISQLISPCTVPSIFFSIYNQSMLLYWRNNNLRKPCLPPPNFSSSTSLQNIERIICELPT
jgi:hypothetical protein